MRTALVRSVAFLLGFFIATTATDIAQRALSPTGWEYFRLYSLVDAAWLMAVVVLPGAFAGFWRFGASQVSFSRAAMMGPVYWALVIGAILVAPAEPNERRVLAVVVIFGGPFLLAWIACRRTGACAKS